MLLLRSILFNIFLYTGIIIVFLLALPTLFLPSKLTLLFGKLLGHYVILMVKIFLNTQVEKLVQSGVSAVIGYTTVDAQNDGVSSTDDGSSWYIGASMSF